MPLIISVSPLILPHPLCRGGMQWVGASTLERCEVASSSVPLISRPSFCHCGDSNYLCHRLMRLFPLLALISCILPVAALLLCFGEENIDSVGLVMQTLWFPPAERRLYRLCVIKTALGTSPSFVFLINFIVPHLSFPSELQLLL